MGLKPRVLVCGGHVRDNNFTRNVEDLGCTVDWHDARAGKPFPKFADAAVIAKFQCSHQGMWDVKQAYLKQNKPVFIADHSFSTIRERFGIFVDGWTAKQEAKQTVMGDAMQKAITQTKYAVAAEPARKRSCAENSYFKYAPGVKDKIKEAVTAHYRARMSLTEAAEQMNKLGLTLANGSPFKSCHISMWRTKFGLVGRQGMCSAHIPAAAAAVAPLPKPASKGPDKVVYELILSANLPAVETTALMRRCMDGKLTQDECLKFIELYTDLKGG